MSKKQASLAIGFASLICGAGVLGWWVLVVAPLNALFIYEFLTMKGE